MQGVDLVALLLDVLALYDNLRPHIALALPDVPVIIQGFKKTSCATSSASSLFFTILRAKVKTICLYRSINTENARVAPDSTLST
jgi:hypothetical protein